MDPIEKAIRAAFEKGNPLDPAFREKVYRSALAALDRALQANPNTTVEAAMRRRAGARGKIEEIESEFVPAVEADSRTTGAASEPEAGLQRERALEVGAAPPRVDAGRAGGTYIEPELDRRPGRDGATESPVARREPLVADPVGRVAGGGAGVAGGGAGVALPGTAIEPEYRRIRRRRPWGGILAGLLVLLLVGGGIWWALSSGVLQTAGPIASEPSAPGGSEAAKVEESSQPPSGLGQEADARDWITVFSPDNPTQVSAPSGAQAEVLEDDGGKFLRISSGASGTPVSFDVGQGILERVAGRRAVFVLVARAEGDQPTQISVTCDLGELGDCGRRRYAVGYERGEFLFDVELPDGRPGSAGTVQIVSDIEGGGKAIDVYEIRVSVTP